MDVRKVIVLLIHEVWLYVLEAILEILARIVVVAIRDCKLKGVLLFKSLLPVIYGRKEGSHLSICLYPAVFSMGVHVHVKWGTHTIQYGCLAT